MTKPTTRKTLTRAEARVDELLSRNVRLAMRNALPPAKRDELGRAYDRRNRAYAQLHGVTVEQARTHYALLLMAQEV